MTTLVFGAAGVLLLGLVAWAGHRMLVKGGGGAGASDAFGNFIDVFDPARSRADEDLRSLKNQGPVMPSPDDDDRPVLLVRSPDGTPRAARVRRPQEPPSI